MDWQTLTAAGIVGITMVIFIIRIARQKKKPGCGHDCGCGKPKDP